jgi:hypothetical protein
MVIFWFAFNGRLLYVIQVLAPTRRLCRLIYNDNHVISCVLHGLTKFIIPGVNGLALGLAYLHLFCFASRFHSEKCCGDGLQAGCTWRLSLFWRDINSLWLLIWSCKVAITPWCIYWCKIIWLQVIVNDALIYLRFNFLNALCLDATCYLISKHPVRWVRLHQVLLHCACWYTMGIRLVLDSVRR